MKLNLGILLFVLCANCFMLGCTPKAADDEVIEAEITQPVPFGLQEILERKKLIAITENSSTSYFIYKGQPLGFEYELLELFAKHLGVELEIVLAEDLDKVIDLLNSGKGDIIAANYTITARRQGLIAFTNPIMLTRQVLVQRLPEKHQRMNYDEIRKNLVRDPIELTGKEVYVRKNSAFYSRLKHLSEEIGAHIQIVEADGSLETEELIEMVANGEIDYTIADENVARLNKSFYPNIDISVPVSFNQKIAWGLRNNAPNLLDTLNSWLDSIQKANDFHSIYLKYFKARSDHALRVQSEFSSLKGGGISEYDALVKVAAKSIDWDWRMLSAVIYQESKFDPNAKSWTGASGLMQMIPETAAKYGVDSTSIFDPAANITAGTKYLGWLSNFWLDKVEDPEQRQKFVLASYNVGLGHIIDARALAEKLNYDSKVWDENVENCLLLKSKPKYYNDPVVKMGYCRGEEPYRYVKNVITRFEHLKRLIP